MNRNKIEKFIIKSEEYNHPNYTFITILLIVLIVIFGIAYYVKLHN